MGLISFFSPSCYSYFLKGERDLDQYSEQLRWISCVEDEEGKGKKWNIIDLFFGSRTDGKRGFLPLLPFLSVSVLPDSLCRTEQSRNNQHLFLNCPFPKIWLEKNHLVSAPKKKKVATLFPVLHPRSLGSSSGRCWAGTCRALRPPARPRWCGGGASASAARGRRRRAGCGWWRGRRWPGWPSCQPSPSPPGKQWKEKDLQVEKICLTIFMEVALGLELPQQWCSFTTPCWLGQIPHVVVVLLPIFNAQVMPKD